MIGHDGVLEARGVYFEGLCPISVKICLVASREYANETHLRCFNQYGDLVYFDVAVMEDRA